MKIRAALISILVISWIKTCSAADDKQNCSEKSIGLAANETFVDQKTVTICPDSCEERQQLTFKFMKKSEDRDCPEGLKGDGNVICKCVEIDWKYIMKQPWTPVCVEKVFIHFDIGKNSSAEMIGRSVENNEDMEPFIFWMFNYRIYRTFLIEIVDKNEKSTKTPVFNFTIPNRYWCNFYESAEDKVEIASSTSTSVFPGLSVVTKIYFGIIGLLYLFIKFL